MVKAQECLVNVYGVVLSFRRPFRTPTGDFMVSVALVDSSLRLDEPHYDRITNAQLPAQFVHVVNLNLFVKQMSDLPDLRYAGDVLRARRVKVQVWEGEIQSVSEYLVTCDDYSCFFKSRLGEEAALSLYFVAKRRARSL